MYSSFVSELVNSNIRPKLYACKDRYFTLEQHYISIEKDMNQGCISLSLSFLHPSNGHYCTVAYPLAFFYGVRKFKIIKNTFLWSLPKRERSRRRDSGIELPSTRPPHIRICTQIKFYLQISWQWFGPCRSAKRWFWWGVILENSPRPRYTTVTSLQNQ